MNELMSPEFYTQIKEILTASRNKTYAAANFAMVEAYWNIGKGIVDYQGGAARAEYGSLLISALTKQMTVDLGKGFTVTNLNTCASFTFYSQIVTHCVAN